MTQEFKNQRQSGIKLWTQGAGTKRNAVVANSQNRAVVVRFQTQNNVCGVTVPDSIGRGLLCNTTQLLGNSNVRNWNWRVTFGCAGHFEWARRCCQVK
jgi:hypothetical protein